MFRRLSIALALLLGASTLPPLTSAQSVLPTALGVVSVQRDVAWPLKAHSSGRYLVDQRGTAFPVLGRNAWSLTEISRANYLQFLNDTVAKGFTAIEIWTPGRYTGTVFDVSTVNPGKDGDNNPAFSKRLDGNNWTGTLSYSNINNEAPDFTQLNPAYWGFVDQFFEDCRTRGILVLWFPSYTGYPGTTEGWEAEMVANGATKMQTYGSTLATRYKNQPNLVWMLGGDQGTGDQLFSSNLATAHDAFVTGLTSVSGQLSIFYSAEWRRSNGGLSGSIATDRMDGSPINLNGIYVSQNQVNNQAERAAAHVPLYPAFVLESEFANHPSGTGGPPRRFSWWGLVSTTNGYFIGDFDIYGFTSGWEVAEDNTYSRDHAKLNQFVRTIPWHTLRPNQAAITAGGGTEDSTDEVRCSVNPTGTQLLCYIPPAHSGSVTIDRTVMSGTFRCRWFDPSYALPFASSYTTISASIPNTTTQAFTPSGNNAAGDGDWVLTCDR